MSRPGDKGDRSIALFLLALLLFSPLFLSIFSDEKLVWGLPPLFLYLFAAWGGIIAAVAWSASKDADDATNAIDPNAPTVIDTLVSDTSAVSDKELSTDQNKKSSLKGDGRAG
ncbi:hypothetical protein WH96_12170 [Kiloniella spongiae]|uniref:Uncharacterized protein n=1 Tax=Kiloniella spongiae TaxID=1489064 RepID=A0A0H2ME56_9PROT|nr:hypothetical protein [Kiloniella spongiae]KLN60471.1 hypothetical protein WH96_12170 [Kiloniella spongiae]